MAPMTPKIAFGYFLVVSIIGALAAAFFGLLDSVNGVEWTELSPLGQVTAIWLTLSIFGLWFWMLADFFRGRPLKHRVAVGFMLLLFNWLAAVIYFLAVYVPHHKKPTSDAQASGTI